MNTSRTSWEIRVWEAYSKLYQVWTTKGWNNYLCITVLLKQDSIYTDNKTYHWNRKLQKTFNKAPTREQIKFSAPDECLEVKWEEKEDGQDGAEMRQTERDMTVTGRALRPHKEDSDKAKFRPLFHSTLRLCQGFNLDITWQRNLHNKDFFKAAKICSSLQIIFVNLLLQGRDKGVIALLHDVDNN